MSNKKAMLAAMLAGTKTKETEHLRALATGDSVVNTDLPSASQMNFKRVVVNGQLQMVEESAAANMKSTGHVPLGAIEGLLAGKKARVINEEMQQQREAEVQKAVPSNKPQSLTETIYPNVNASQHSEAELEVLIENKVYDIFGSIMGVVNDNLKNKEIIKQTLAEAVTFLKLKQSLLK